MILTIVIVAIVDCKIKTMKDNIIFKKEVEGLYKIYLGCVLIGHLSVLKDFYEVSIQYHTFTVEKGLKRFIKKMILESYKTTNYLIEAERRNLPIRISRTL